MLYYETEFSKLYNGDCIEEMNKLNCKVDKVITSPPYNIIRPNLDDRGYDEYNDGMTNEEYLEWIINIFNVYDKILNKNGCICWNMSYGGENSNLMSLCIADIIRKTNFELADVLVWKKTSAIPNNVSSNRCTRIVEFIYIFARKGELGTFTTNKKIIGNRNSGQAIYQIDYNFFEARNNDATTPLNKATFSTEFVNELIERYVLPTDVVLDNFSGTGTTMFACERRNRKGIYIEISEKQCEYAKNRIGKGIQTNLFDIME